MTTSEELLQEQVKRIKLLNRAIEADLEARKRLSFRLYLSAVANGMVVHRGTLDIPELCDMALALVRVENEEFGGAAPEAIE